MFTTQLVILQLQQSCTLIKPTLMSYILWSPWRLSEKLHQKFQFEKSNMHAWAQIPEHHLKSLVNIAMNTTKWLNNTIIKHSKTFLKMKIHSFPQDFSPIKVESKIVSLPKIVFVSSQWNFKIWNLVPAFCSPPIDL